MQGGATRVAVGTAAITLVGASFVGLEGMTDGLRAEVEVWAEEAVEHKVYVRGLPPVPFDALSRRLHDFPGVLAVERGSARTHERFLLFGMDAEELARSGPLAERPVLAAQFAKGVGMIVSRRLASAEGLEVGRPVWITEADGDVRELRVLLISDAHGFFPSPDERLYGIVAAEVLRQAYCVDAVTVTDVAVRLEPDTDPEVVEAAVLAFLSERPSDGTPPAPESPGNLRFESGESVRDLHLADIDRDFILFDFLIAATALLAALGVLNGQLLAALERRREVGILRSLGTTRAQVAGTVLLEALVVGGMGGLFGALIGAAATPLVVNAIEGLAGLALPTTTPLRWMLTCQLGAILLALLACLYPIWRATRSELVGAVRAGG
jgi:hypothetical protein